MQLPNLACFIVPIAHQDWTAPLDSHLSTASLFPCQNAVFESPVSWLAGWMFCELKLCARFPGLAIPGPRNEPSGVARALTFSCNEPPISYHWTPNTVPLYPLHCTIVPSTSYHCTLYFVPLYPVHRTIVPRTSYHDTPFIVPIAPPLSYHCAPYMVPLHPLHYTIAPLHRTSVPPSRTTVPPTSHHCTPRTAPLCTWCTCITVPLRCLHCTIAPSLRTPVPALRTP